MGLRPNNKINVKEDAFRTVLKSAVKRKAPFKAHFRDLLSRFEKGIENLLMHFIYTIQFN